MTTGLLRIATRKSTLALWQAEHVAQRLRGAHRGLRVELVPLSTRGDRIKDVPLAELGGKALFVKELEHALLEDRADIAVHSMKDVPVEIPAGLHLPVIMEREDPRDAFVSNHYARVADIPRGARIGTCSLRRKSQLLGLRPDLQVADLRGNVETRLSKLDAGDYDAIVLACAGLMRLGLHGRIAESIDPQTLLPAIGQGAMGVECRQGDGTVEALIAPLNHGPSAARLRAERAVNARLGGSCQVPVAGYAEIEADRITLRALVARLDGSEVLRAHEASAVDDAEVLGRRAAEGLLAQGAGEILGSLPDNAR